LLKGCEQGITQKIKIGDDGKPVLDADGNPVLIDVPKLTLTGNGFVNEMIYGANQETYSNPKIINGGYFEHPLYRGKEQLYTNPKTKE
jgi:hypothetical protein